MAPPALPLTTRRVSEAVVQRALRRPQDPPPVQATAASLNVVQRAPDASEGERAPERAEAEEIDLDALAREIYPLIRRMLRIERERERRP